MTKRNVGSAAVPPTRSNDAGVAGEFQRGRTASAAKPPTLRAFVAALLFAPLAACAVPAPAESAAPAAQPAAPRAEPVAPPPSPALDASAPAPAAQQPATAPRRPGDTTTGRPPAQVRPAPTSTAQPSAPAPVPLPGDQPAPSVTAPAAQPPAATPAPSQQAPQVALPGSSPTSGPAAGSLLQTILALVLVLAVLLGLAWFLKRFGPRMTGSSAHLRVVGSLNIGARERIMVVEVGDQWIVVGASPGRINTLATMPRQEGVEVAAAPAGYAQPAASFSDWLKNTIDKRNAK